MREKHAIKLHSSVLNKKYPPMHGIINDTIILINMKDNIVTKDTFWIKKSKLSKQ